jgi:hypothetical protein
MNEVTEVVKEGVQSPPSNTKQPTVGLPNLKGPTLNGPITQVVDGPSKVLEEKKIPAPTVPEKPKVVYYEAGEREVRIGSRKVRVEIIPKFNMLPKDPKAKQIRNEVIKKVSSTWKAGTKDIIRGLNHAEEQLYLPNIIALKPSHDDWVTRVYEYWANFAYAVPVEGGVTLETGFRLKGNAQIGWTGEPINVTDYIKYNFAKENAMVAPEDADNMITYTFKIIDTSADALREEQTFSLRMQVDRLFFKLVDESKTIESEKAKIDHILETIGGDKGLGVSVYNWTDIQKQVELEKVKNRNLGAFKAILDDRYLENKSIIKKGVTFKKIVEESGTYFYNGKGMGRTLNEACLWLDDPANSYDKIILLEAISKYTK